MIMAMMLMIPCFCLSKQRPLVERFLTLRQQLTATPNGTRNQDPNASDYSSRGSHANAKIKASLLFTRDVA
jgi:hypothetical protein